MGWHKVQPLVADDNPFDGPDGLWTRGGIDGVAVTVGGKWYAISRSVIEQLVAEDIRNQAVSRWESKDDDEVLRYIGMKD